MKAEVISVKTNAFVHIDVFIGLDKYCLLEKGKKKWKTWDMEGMYNEVGSKMCCFSI